uniref:Methyltransferase-like protein 9 n=1 Tax=Culex tarsalis TaxID=7177 RepID=A0A1Q3G289_CULTA
MSYQPKGFLARLLIDKFRNDTVLENCDMSEWYSLQNIPKEYRNRFINMGSPDEITLQWIEQSRQESSKLWLQLWHLLAKAFLSVFMTQTDVNGILRRGSMYILSENQFQTILINGGLSKLVNNDNNNMRVLDIGAGDGEVTARLVNAISLLKPDSNITLFATESSWVMKSRLAEKHIQVIEEINQLNNIHFISCLNVLDRCIDPLALLHEIYNALAPDGRLMVALVLPYSHYVEKNSSHLPLRPLLDHWPKYTGMSIDKEIEAFFKQLENVGFKILSWTKAPYLCEGDLRQSYYWLDDIVVVCSK